MDFYYFSKLFWFFAAPSHLLIWLALGGLLLRRYRAGRIALAVTTLTFLVLLFVPAGDWALTSLENQYARGPWPDRVDGVLELGGGLDSHVLKMRGIPGAPLEGRVVASFELARRYPKARIVFSGGGDPHTDPEARVARFILEEQLGLPPGRILYEDRSRDTWENFLFSKNLAKPKPGETWLLVTSALHMPRAMAIAARMNWPMQPWPSDYVTPGDYHLYSQNLAVTLGNLDVAAHEWVGLLVYRLAGRAR